MAKKDEMGQQSVSSGFVPATTQSARQGMQPAVMGANGSVGVAGQYSRNNPNYKNRNHGMSRKGKIALVIVIIALVAGAAAAGLYVYKEMQKSAINADLHKMSEEQMKAVDAELTGSTTFDEPFTVLLLGSDARADDPDMGARTDTIIVVRVDPTENIVSMMSIPRDTMIEIDGAGTQKFNAAYTYGGASGTIAAVKKLTGVDIDHYAEINFEGLVGLVDAIGGIDVEIEEEIDDDDAGGHLDAGKQHLNGEQALILARSRAYVDGDFTRQANQRKVIMAIINKGLTAPATELSGLIKASTKFLTTDSAMDFDFIYSLADQIRHNNEKEVRIYSASIPSRAANINEVSYVVADMAGLDAMVKIFLKGGDISQEIKESSISEDIEAAGGKVGGSQDVSPVEDTSDYGDGVTYYEEPQQTYVEQTNADNAQGNVGQGDGAGNGGDNGGNGGDGDNGDGGGDNGGTTIVE